MKSNPVQFRSRQIRLKEGGSDREAALLPPCIDRVRLTGFDMKSIILRLTS
ncbi:MAG: hypothetical protein MUE44_12660 [Oscillatoriaceae cyanobacterium Prado104]|nr:hypothetical protein [Oscillatoriaceae cyanobacterium Prado104]